jgi:hypothetical protein
VHNLFFAIVYTGIGIMTFGLSGSAFANDRDHHWGNAYYSFLSIFTAIASIITPKYGSYLSIYLFIKILGAIQEDYNKDIINHDKQLIDGVKQIFNDNYLSIYNKAKDWYGKSFDVQEGPALEWLRLQINQAQSIHFQPKYSDQVCLVNIIDEFWRKFPYLKPKKEENV